MSILEKQLESRLGELRSEFEKGQQKLQELEAEASGLRDMLLRISGAMQVLQEELDKAGSNGSKES